MATSCSNMDRPPRAQVMVSAVYTKMSESRASLQMFTATSNMSSFEMKKWKIAQRKMAWQVTGDRNIGGHTARIPDTFNFLAGPGPRGVGIDLSSKDLIEKLAEIIIPEATISKKNQLCLKLENRWIEHHGQGMRYNSASRLGKHSSRSTRTSGSNSRDVTSFFDKSSINQETVQNMIAQLKLAATASEPALDQPDKISEEHPDSDDTVPKTDADETDPGTSAAAPETASETEPDQPSDPAPDTETDPLTFHLDETPPKTAPQTCPNAASQRHRLRAAAAVDRSVKRTNRETIRSRAAQQNSRKHFKNSKRISKTGSRTSVNSTRSRREARKNNAAAPVTEQTLSLVQSSKNSIARHSVTPDSGFHSDTKSSASISNLSKPNSPALRRKTSETKLGKLSRTVSDIFKQSKPSSLLNLKKRKSESELSNKTEADLSAVPENALLWLRKKSGSRASLTASSKTKSICSLMETGGSRHARQLRKACRVTEVVSILTRNKFIMPTIDNYDVQGLPKDGQSFTRRRTRGQMYSTLEPIVYSDVYKRSNSGHFTNTASALTRMKNTAGGFF